LHDPGVREFFGRLPRAIGRDRAPGSPSEYLHRHFASAALTSSRAGGAQGGSEKDSFRFRWAVAAPGGRTGQGESVGLTRGGRTDDPRRKFFSIDLARQSRSPACAGFAGGLEDQRGKATD